MKRASPTYVRAHPRHPLTGKQFVVRARTARELEALLHRIDSLREELRLSMISEADVDKALRRIRYGAVTLGKVAESYSRRVDLSPDTLSTARSMIAGPLRELAPLALDELEAPALSKHFERLSGRMSRRSLTSTWWMLKAFVRHAAERGWTSRVPWGAWKPRLRAGQPGRPLRECCRNAPELEQLLAAAQDVDEEDLAGGRPYRALTAKIAAAAYLGLRQGELAGLEWHDLIPDHCRVRIARQWDGARLKAGDAGEIDAEPVLFDILGRHAERLGLAQDGRSIRPLGSPVFPAPGSRRPAGAAHYARGSETIPLETLRAIVRRAGLPNPARWTAHSMRDTFVTMKAQERPGDLEWLRQQSRHASIASLVRYLRSFEREGGPRLLGPSGGQH